MQSFCVYRFPGVLAPFLRTLCDDMAWYIKFWFDCFSCCCVAVPPSVISCVCTISHVVENMVYRVLTDEICIFQATTCMFSYLAGLDLRCRSRCTQFYPSLSIFRILGSLSKSVLQEALMDIRIGLKRLTSLRAPLSLVVMLIMHDQRHSVRDPFLVDGQILWWIWEDAVWTLLSE